MIIPKIMILLGLLMFILLGTIYFVKVFKKLIRKEPLKINNNKTYIKEENLDNLDIMIKDKQKQGEE